MLSNKKLLLVALFLFLPSCSEWSNLINSDTDQLNERAHDRWQALLEKRWEIAYSYELPAYRKTHDLKQFEAKFGRLVRWQSADIVNVGLEKDANLANVNVKVKFEISMSDGQPFESDKLIKERWMKQEGSWWFVSSE